MADNVVAYGFINLKNLMAQRVTMVGEKIIRTAIEQSAAEWSRQAREVVGVFCTPTIMGQENFKQPGSGTLQPLDEWGNPLPVQEGAMYTVGFPIQGGGTAWGTNRVTRAMMTVQEANDNTLGAMRKDADWLRRHILAALFDNVAWTFTDELLGALTVQPLANGDTVTYIKTDGTVATDDHYLAQAAAIADATNPFPTIYDELTEHPGNGDTVVVYVASALVASIKALTAFVENPDPDVVPTTAGDTLGNDGSQYVGPGSRVHGKVNGCWIVEWKALPTTYMVAVCPDAEPALAMREYDATDLQGFFTENHSPDGNLREQRMIRYAGFGARNRVAALVYYVGAAAYVIPTGYDAPLPI